MIVATIFQSRKQWQTRYPYLFTATVAALLAVGNTVRGVVHLVHSAEVTSLLQPSLWSIFFLSAGTVVLPILTFGAMMMVHDRMVRHARHVGSRDFLTGAFTRTVFLKTLEQAMQRSGAMTHDTALLLFSVKNLPALRKAGGDAVADQVLVDVALQAERVIKLPRWFARIGVEEFAVLLPQTSHDAALSFAQRLLAGLVSSGILGRFASIDGLPSGAIGMGLAVSLEDDTVYDLLARAECALAAAGDAPASRIVSAETEADDVSL
jgi:diguanylate cyclase (GGDEF)-like protein